MLSGLKLEFICCSSNTDAERRMYESSDCRLAGVSQAFPSEEGEVAIVGAVLPTILAGSPPSSPKHEEKAASWSGTPTSASSRTRTSSIDLPIGPKIRSESLTSSSCCSEVSEHADDSGAIYRGQWLGEQRHGHGVLARSGGERYEGQFWHGVAHGRGRLVDVDSSLYEGQWQDNDKHGFGMYSFPDGTTYGGQWVCGKKHGTGSEHWADGAKFEGQFAEGFKNGAGIYRDSTGLEYIGQFRHDKMDGIGTYVFECGRKYSGHWREGRMHGHGKMEWANGTVYEGGYEVSMRSGVGTLTAPDGSSYCGQWSAGKQHGKGLLKDQQGNCWHEAWEHGTCVSSAPDGGSEELLAETPSTPGDAGSVFGVAMVGSAALSEAQEGLAADIIRLPSLQSDII